MRLAFLVADYPVTSETFIVRQIRGMVAAGHQADVLVGRMNPTLPDPLAGAVPLRCVRARTGSLGRWAVSAPLRLARGLAGPHRAGYGRSLLAAARGYRAPLADLLGVAAPLGRYDAIISHFGPMGVRAMYLRDAGLVDGPIATVFHGLDMSDRALLAANRPYYDRLFRSTALLLPISELWRQRLLDWGAPADRIAVLHMGVDLDTLLPIPAGRPFGAPLRVLSVARLVEKKGLRDAIDGVARATVPIAYDIVGEGPLQAELRAQAAGSANPVTFLGRLAHAEVLKLLPGYDVFLLPSVTAAGGDMEGIPVSLMEAMAIGVLPLATRHSGIPELITDGVNGLLVDERDADGIAAALSALAGGRQDVAALRRAGRATIAAGFDNTKLDESLQQLLSRCGPDGRATPS